MSQSSVFSYTQTISVFFSKVSQEKIFLNFLNCRYFSGNLLKLPYYTNLERLNDWPNMLGWEAWSTALSWTPLLKHYQFLSLCYELSFDIQPFYLSREINSMANIWIHVMQFILEYYKYAANTNVVTVSKVLSLFSAPHLSETHHLHLQKCMALRGPWLICSWVPLHFQYKHL